MITTFNARLVSLLWLAFVLMLAGTGTNARAQSESEAECKRAYDYVHSEMLKRDGIQFSDEVVRWALRYERNRRNGEPCSVPPLTIKGEEPDRDMAMFRPDVPFQPRYPVRYSGFATELNFNASQPAASECETASQALSIMRRRDFRVLSPEELLWQTGYEGALARGELCSPIPDRLAVWAQELVWSEGWKFPAPDVELQSFPGSSFDSCRVLLGLVEQDRDDRETLRWITTYVMNERLQPPNAYQRSLRVTTCPVAPKVLWDRYGGQVIAIRDQRYQDRVDRMRQAEFDRMQEQAEYRAREGNRPASADEVFRRWNEAYKNRVIIEERCYISSYGNRTCYERGSRAP